MHAKTLALLLLGSTLGRAETLQIQSSAGWLESAWATWKPVSGAESYRVTWSGAGKVDQVADAPLVRSYGDYLRVDLPGLATGAYTVKIEAMAGGKVLAWASTPSLAVAAHDRSGFAYAGGRLPGAYAKDGTLEAGAVVLYVTEKTKNTVQATVTGASANPCIGFQAILDALKKGKDTLLFAFRLVGRITDPAYTLGGDVVIENGNNAASRITLEGVGHDATADGWGIRLKNASNVEVRNLGVMNVDSDEGDDVGLQQGNDHIWVHHMDLFYGLAGGDADQAKGDGSLDCKKSTFVTFSYNHFWDNGKSNLLGLSEGAMADLYITYHHNWYDHSDSRHPRVRFYSAHVYNNYYDGNSKYGIGSTEGSSVFAEGNYFRHCKHPMMTSMQGTDVWSEAKKANDYKDIPTFSAEDGGNIKAWNNFMEGQARFVAYGDAAYPNPTVDFDAFVATSRDQRVPATVKAYQGGKTYDNFDTDASLMYTYVPDQPAKARDLVVERAGRTGGGDFRWHFDNAVDDTSSSVNQGLKAALLAYRGSVQGIQGEGPLPVAALGRSRAAGSGIRFDPVSRRILPTEGSAGMRVRIRALDGAEILDAALPAQGLPLRSLPSGLCLVETRAGTTVLSLP